MKVGRKGEWRGAGGLGQRFKERSGKTARVLSRDVAKLRGRWWSLNKETFGVVGRVGDNLRGGGCRAAAWLKIENDENNSRFIKRRE